MADMKFSTGNQIKGKIMEIRKGAVTAIVYVAVPGDTTLEASVTIAVAGDAEALRGQAGGADDQPGRHHHRLRVGRDAVTRSASAGCGRCPCR